MTDDDGDDDTMEGRLAHILESDAMDTVDLWLTIVACLAAIETLYVCALATYRYSRRVYHLPLQRWTIRVLLVGPVRGTAAGDYHDHRCNGATAPATAGRACVRQGLRRQQGARS